MYLTYSEYQNMGGALDETAYNTFNRKAEYAVNSQANGKAGERIGKLTELPQAVKDCIFDLIECLSANAFDGTAVQSESQSLGGQSESYTYARLTKTEADAQVKEIITTYLSPIKYKGVSVLYRGACV